MKIIAIVLGAALFQLMTQGAAQAQSLDAFAVMDQQKFNCARSIAITSFPVEGEFKASKDPGYYQEYFATRLAPALRRIPGIEKVEIVDGNAAVSADLVIDGSFLDLTSGSRALRFWAGSGAGKSTCCVEMKGVDAATGTEIFTLEHDRSIALDVVTDDVMVETLDEVILDVVAGLSSARGACSPATSRVAAK